jgi:apolipoprotein N-acyltransferase
VPFGEFVPFDSLLRGMIGFFNLPMSYTLPGPDQPVILKTAVGDVGTAICYEVAYTGLVLSAAQNADILLTISNDTWFGRSLGPDQHLQIAQMRALETGRYMMRATNSGITAIINHKGDIIARLPQDELGTLTGFVTTMNGKTPLMRLVQ